jgi:hypothetical protein
MRADGTHIRWIDREGNTNTLDGQPSWSPDGRKLVFIKTISPASSGALFASSLYTINADGSGRRFWRTQPSTIQAHHGSTTGTSLSPPLGGDWQSSTPGPAGWNARSAYQYEARSPHLIPALSPNGREIASVECDNADCSFASVDLITLRGHLLRRIRGAHTPAWLPRGDLVYACCQQAGIRGNTSRIMLAPPRGRPSASNYSGLDLR